VNGLYALLLGRRTSSTPLHAAFANWAQEPTDADLAWERLTSGRTQRSMWDYDATKDLLIALLEQYSDDFDKSVEELGTIVDRLRQAWVEGFVSSTMNDPTTACGPRTGARSTSTREDSRRCLPRSAPDSRRSRKERNEAKDQPQP